MLTIIAFVVSPIGQSYYLASTMRTAFTQSEIISFDQNIFTVINELKKKRKLDIDSIHKEIIKTIEFEDSTKDDLQDRIKIILINEKLIDRINRNFNSRNKSKWLTNDNYLFIACIVLVSISYNDLISESVIEC